MNSKPFESYTISFVKDKERNGGYCRVGDGNMVTKLHLSKNGVKMTLTDTEIQDLMKTLSGINPTIRVS